MTLTVGTGATFASPTPPQIHAALAALEGARRPVATLTATGGAFVRASGSPRTGFLLEYQWADGACLRASDLALGLPAVAAVFDRFAAGEPDPMGGLATEVVDPDHADRPPRRVQWVAGPALLAVGAVYLVAGDGALLHRACALGVSATFAAFIADGLRRGAVDARWGPYTRAGDPALYAFHLLMYGVVSALSLGLAVLSEG